MFFIHKDESPTRALQTTSGAAPLRCLTAVVRQRRMKTITQRYGLPFEGGTVTTEPHASSLLVEVGLIDKFQLPKQRATAPKRTYECIADATIPDYLFGGFYFHGFDREEDNGYAVVLMSKERFSLIDLLAHIKKLAQAMDGELVGFRPYIIDNAKKN